MLRLSVLTIAVALSACPVLARDKGTDKERAACHPDVVKFCQTQLEANLNDPGGILNCLQTNRAKISSACQKVFASHGQ
jgi:hypothetical protein